MPLTPFHLGPGFFSWILAPKFFNLWAIIFGSVVMDIEPLILILIKRCYYCPHHGFFHSILGAIFGSLILAKILSIFRKRLNQISLKFKICQSFSFKNLYFSSLFAWLIHIFFDNLTHDDVFLFWPLNFKPFFVGKRIYWLLNFVFLIFGIFSFLIFVFKIKKEKNVRY
jgi:membrane-bound metal-dependent hydrolase YbcI (DUF457 family)